jgi:uncharacterized protein YkwD
MRLKGVVLLLFFLGLVGCKRGASVNPTNNNTTGNTNNTLVVTTTVTTNLDNAALLKLVNNVRATGCNCGTTAMPPVAPLSWNDVLAKSSLIHSTDMNATGQFIHNSSDGTSFSDRITASGYKWRTVGENIAAGQKTEQQVFTDWLNSEGHCKNMMNGSFKDMGAARVSIYWTQDFGATQ